MNQEDTTQITFDNAGETLRHLQAFALEFCEEGNGEPKPLRWIEDRALVDRFRLASGLAAPQFDPPITALQHRAYVRLQSGEVRAFWIYRCTVGAPGLITFADGCAKTTPDLHAVILEAYGLALYSPREESRRVKTRAQQTAVTTLDEDLQQDVEQKLAEARPETPFIDPWVVVVWSDYPGQNTNRNWAAWFENQRTVNTYTMQANGLNAIVTVLRSIRNAGNEIRQIIMSVHGTVAEFDLRSPNDPFNSAYCCGLYPHQTTPLQFGKAVSPYMVHGSTITLLSCETAGVQGAYDGRMLMSQICFTMRSYVIASDQDVYVSNAGAACHPYTSGNIYRSTPIAPNPAIYLPAYPNQNIPIGYF